VVTIHRMLLLRLRLLFPLRPNVLDPDHLCLVLRDVHVHPDTTPALILFFLSKFIPEFHARRLSLSRRLPSSARATYDTQYHVTPPPSEIIP